MAVGSSPNIKITLPSNAYHVQHYGPGEGSGHSGDHIIDKKPTTALKIKANKLYNSVFNYAPKGMKGSVNSNFHEYLVMGDIPYILGSLTFIGLFGAVNKAFQTQDKFAATLKSNRLAAGVVLYGVGKWLGNRLANKLTDKSTAIDLDLPCEIDVSELPENGKEVTRKQYRKVFESVDFPMLHLLLKKGEAQGDRLGPFDKITRKMGYKEKLNAPDQATREKIKQTTVRATAGKSISSYLWAAMGVAIAAQKPFETYKIIQKGDGFLGGVGHFIKNTVNTFTRSAKDLWTGGEHKNVKAAGVAGKALIVAALGSTLLTWLSVLVGFHSGKNLGKSAVDFKKDYEGV